MDLSVVVPTYNEELRIGRSLETITRYLKSSKIRKWEIIVVDDGSEDRTSDIVEGWQSKDRRIRIVRNESNKGKGYAVRRGILDAMYPLVLFSDADLATPISELEKFAAYISSGYDIVIASRNIDGARIEVMQPFYRQFLGKGFPLLVELVTGMGFKDTQCGFKLFRAAVAKQIVMLQRINGYCFDVELLWIARKRGYRIKEAPVVWIDQVGSKVNPLRDALNMLTELMEIRLNDLSRKYS